MKYPLESLDLYFPVIVRSSCEYLYVWETTPWCLPLKKMFCYTMGLDYDGDLTTTDIEKIQEYFSPYFDETDVKWLSKDGKEKAIRVELFLAMVNSPRCPYKIIGVSNYIVSTEVVTQYHFMLKYDILPKLNQIDV